MCKSNSSHPSGDHVQRGCYYKTMDLPNNPKCMLWLNQINSSCHVELTIHVDNNTNTKAILITIFCTFSITCFVISILIKIRECKSRKPAIISNQRPRNDQRNQLSEPASTPVNQRLVNASPPRANDEPPPYSSLI